MASPNSDLTKKLLEQKALNCESCSKLLKIPVYLLENRTVCADCAGPFVKTSDARHVKIYDLFINDLNIPCRLPGCQELVPYDDYEEHLNDCKFRRVQCILSPACNWTGTLHDLCGHFKKRHGDNVVATEMFVFTLDTRQPDKALTKLLVKDNNMYFFVVRLDAHEISYNLFQVDNKGDSHAVIRHFYNKHDIRLEISAEPMNAIDKQPSSNKIALSNLQLILENNRILSIKVDLPSNKSDVLLPYLDCPICQEVMKPPIYQCSVGHSLCAVCTGKLTACPTCKSPIGKDIRNYSLEALASNASYDCAYKAYGCDEIVLGGTIKEHESKCPYMSYSCPMSDCLYRSRFSSFKKHVVDKHPEVLHCSKYQCKVANLFQSDHSVKICHDGGAIYAVHFHSLISIMAKTFLCDVKVLGQDFAKCKISIENPGNGCGIGYTVTQAGKVQFVESSVAEILKCNTNLNFCFEICV